MRYACVGDPKIGSDTPSISIDLLDGRMSNVSQPLMTGILISWGPINPYGLGLSFPSPIIWK